EAGRRLDAALRRVRGPRPPLASAGGRAHAREAEKLFSGCVAWRRPRRGAPPARVACFEPQGGPVAGAAFARALRARGARVRVSRSGRARAGELLAASVFVGPRAYSG